MHDSDEKYRWYQADGQNIELSGDSVQEATDLLDSSYHDSEWDLRWE